MSTNQAGGISTADTEIGSRIANALIVKGTNMRALSDKTGISYPTLRRSLSGGRSLTIREIGNIAGVLEVPAAVLLPPSLTEVTQ
ncbi:transcriptional repressor [Arthrobacter phage Kumotta]|uniref:Helix-turn-helix DNA-binding domain protein n=2 Tax=Kumottavirus TaxID=3044749 RepID=A0A4Y6ELE9_9CAUD|nr:transcriptional repressor [Arthrobacter phage Kumotta]YP_010649515.1 transcriptional repressor [Arthrobacter phage MargaretKali]AXH44413.1 helix-turn-helix DNA binding domain protein [Arthrobacter phage MargaretKali]QDF19543.1 helix-turn-helix DNA-binding domain protein [Arthrobacter phage Kumotta]